MRNKYFNTIVEKVLKLKWRLVEIEKLKKLVQNVLDSDYSDQKFYKLVYYLKNRWYVYALKKDIYFIKWMDDVYSDQHLLDMFYWMVVKKHCTKYLVSDWYIGGIKALELNISSFDISDDLLIINKYKQSSEILMLKKRVIYKKYYSENKKLFTKFYKFTHKVHIKNNVFQVADLELSLLESLYNTPPLLQWYVDELVKKVLRKYKKDFNVVVWKTFLINNKHHSSVNRLYKLSLSVDPELADVIKQLIKRYSYFISV